MLDVGRSLIQPAGAFNRSSPWDVDGDACGAFETTVGGVPQAQQKTAARNAALVLMVKQYT